MNCPSAQIHLSLVLSLHLDPALTRPAASQNMPPRPRRTLPVRQKPTPKPAPSTPGTSSHDSSTLSPVKSTHSQSLPPEDEDEGNNNDDHDEDPFSALLVGSSTTFPGDFDMETKVEDEDDETEAESIAFRYPASVSDFTTLPEREQQFKIARFVPCQMEGCDCQGLDPPEGSRVSLATREEVEMEETGEEGWWTLCGICGHGWEDEGHVWGDDVSGPERVRRGKVVGRIEEMLQVCPTWSRLGKARADGKRIKTS